MSTITLPHLDDVFYRSKRYDHDCEFAGQIGSFIVRVQIVCHSKIRIFVTTFKSRNLIPQLTHAVHSKSTGFHMTCLLRVCIKSNTFEMLHSKWNYILTLKLKIRNSPNSYIIISYSYMFLANILFLHNSSTIFAGKDLMLT